MHSKLLFFTLFSILLSLPSANANFEAMTFLQLDSYLKESLQDRQENAGSLSGHIRAKIAANRYFDEEELLEDRKELQAQIESIKAIEGLSQFFDKAKTKKSKGRLHFMAYTKVAKESFLAIIPAILEADEFHLPAEEKKTIFAQLMRGLVVSLLAIESCKVITPQFIKNYLFPADKQSPNAITAPIVPSFSSGSGFASGAGGGGGGCAGGMCGLHSGPLF
jgi:hypothetical protein